MVIGGVIKSDVLRISEVRSLANSKLSTEIEGLAKSDSLWTVCGAASFRILLFTDESAVLCTSGMRSLGN